ncbi:MAG: ABC transporter substrate-binding protein [Chloroflexota bacterium]
MYNTGKYCKSGATPITFWAWIPGINKVVDMFNQTHPKICVQLQNVGAGPPEYNKLLLDIRAKKGLPDLAEVEYSALPEFEVTHSLVNLANYGAGKLKPKFAPGFWSLVTKGSAIYAIPGDTGPMGLLVNTAFMKKYNLAIPTTWQQLSQEAIKLHKAHPKVYLTNFPPNSEIGYLALLEQAGARPFHFSGNKATYNFQSPAALKVANYWQKLLSQHAVDTLNFQSNQSYKAMIGQPSVLFPSFLPMLNSTLLSNSTLPLTGNQHYYVPFIKGASNLPTDWQWGPFNVYERTQQDNALAQVANGKMTLVQAMKQVQTKMINYAQSQGLSASS